MTKFNQPTFNNLKKIINNLAFIENINQKKINAIMKNFPKKEGGFFTKSEILDFYRKNKTQFNLNEKKLLQILQLKPIRTMSGVATVTVLTKPYPCPGHCLFCPNDIRMPKSYLPSEPGAQRAESNYFDPYLQTINRLTNLEQMGHNLNKIEIIILGGTWTAYPQDYQIFFITKIFEALNDYSSQNLLLLTKKITQIINIYQQANKKLKKENLPFSTNNAKTNQILLAQWQNQMLVKKENYNQLIQQIYLANDKITNLNFYQKSNLVQLIKQQQKNETSKCRNVGLVIETRPDEIKLKTLIFLRKLGITKIQLGIQSLNSKILKLNRRFITQKQISNSFQLLRNFGFKIHIHFMANLYGSNPQKDIKDYYKLFNDQRFRPDEVKLYPCSLIESAPLMHFYLTKKWHPYNDKELLLVLRTNLLRTPEYCRITRMIRDISSNDIVTGNKKTNFRQIVETSLKKDQLKIKEIRSREIKNQSFNPQKIKFKVKKYLTNGGTNYFLNFQTNNSFLLGYLRLFLPHKCVIEELKQCAIIREIHVYGQVVQFGESIHRKAQHLGLGTKLIQKARKIAKKLTYKKLAVISAIGTREYYRKKGFSDGLLYQYLTIK